MHNAASDFLSADSAINLVFRRKRSISKSEIRKRIRRNEEYFYDDYSKDYELYGVLEGSNSSITDFEDKVDFNENQDFSMQTGAPTMEVANDAKKEIKKSLMGAMGSVANEIASPESLLQAEVKLFLST